MRCGCILWNAYDVPMLLNPTTRYLYPQRELPNGAEVNLIPGLFKAGTPRADVVATLRAAGFESWPDYAKPEFSEVYHRWAGSTLACGYEFFVQLAFGRDGGLTKAVNHQGGVCL